MLEYIRSSAQSFGVKVAFGVIILVFVFWGVGNFNDSDYSNVVAVVNGEPIVAVEFEKAYHNAEEYLLRNNPGLTREELAKRHLGRQVLRDLIQDTLLAQEAARGGIVVSPQEMRLAVEQMKIFQDDRGRFDPDAYRRVLASQRMSPAQYEQNLYRQLLRDKMFSLVTAPAWVAPDEAENRFNFLRERRIVDYLFIPADRFRNKVQLNETEIKAYYDDNQEEFAIPPKVNVEYIAVSPAALVEQKSISEAEARAWYEANKSTYERREQVRARHILVPLAQDADEAAQKAAMERLSKARAEIASGKSFAAVANEYNEAGAADKGGELGWISRGETVPEFEEAVFSLPVGKISEPVRTPFGFHIILVEEKKPAGTAAFEEVAEEIYKTLAFEKGSDKIHEVLDDLIEENILMKPLAESAAKYNLKSLQSGLVDRAGLMEKLKINEDGASSLMGVAAGAPLDTALEAENSYVIARVLKSEPAGTKSLETVREEIKNRLVQRQELNLTRLEAENILAKIKKEDFVKVKEQYPDIRTSQPLERGSVLDGFEQAPIFNDAVFANPLHTWLPKPLDMIQKDGKAGVIIAYIDKLVPAEKGEFESVEQILVNATRQERLEGLYEMFMTELSRNAKVEIVNGDLVDRIAQ